MARKTEATDGRPIWVEGEGEEVDGEVEVEVEVEAATATVRIVRVVWSIDLVQRVGGRSVTDKGERARE